MKVYLDNSATTKQADEVTSEMIRIVRDCYGNPSSLHTLGVSAEKELKAARKKLAAVCGASDEEICFTSGGTESDNIAIFQGAELLKRQGNKIITSKTEHPAVLECCKKLESQGFEVVYADVDKRGFVNPENIKKIVDDKTILVSIMHVNNETGTIQPISEIGDIIYKASREMSHKILFHCDAVQSFGKLRTEVKSAHIDLLSASAHKLHGPRGVGLLYVNRELHLRPLICGGGQESGLRSGTENLPGIAGFAAAIGADIRDESASARVTGLRDLLLEGIRAEIPDVVVNSPVDEPDGCLPHILNVSFVGARGEVLLHMLEQAGIFVSTGSACSSRKRGGSHVLAAMGLSPEELEGALRFSFTHKNTVEEMEYTVEKLKKSVAEHRRILSIASGGRRR